MILFKTAFPSATPRLEDTRLEGNGRGLPRRLGAVAVVLLLVIALAPPLGTARAADVVATGLRVSETGGQIRFVLDVSREIGFRLFHLADPYRVVIDLPEVGWRLPAEPLPGDLGAFERVRYGLFRPGNSRVVMDLTAPATISAAFLIPPTQGSQGVREAHRLVVELTPATPVAFQAEVDARPIEISGLAQRYGGVQTAAPPPPVLKTAVAKSKRLFTTVPIPPKRPKRRLASSPRIIVIDPGHGGADPGATGPSGTFEKHIVLAIAKEIRRQFEDSGRYRVVLTRERDVFIGLRDRVTVARRHEAEAFISIHADSIRNSRISGPSVYTLSEKASDKEAAALAERENKADLIAGIDLSHESREVTNILIDLAQRETLNQSSRLAAVMVRSLGQRTKVLPNPHRFAGFAVLKAPDVPSVLLETGFLSNEKDEKNLMSATYRRTLASSILEAVDAYFKGVEQASAQ